MTNASNPAKTSYAVCNTCTIRLVELCYRRAWWFRFVREPLRLGMRIMAWWHGIDPRDYVVRTEACRGCIRFMKTALKEKSAAFRRLNDWINPLFDWMMERIVTAGEVENAKRYARESTHPK
ncbi:MAG: nitroreductase [Planctomycetota bacterium]